MSSLIRRYQQPLMIVLTILTILIFVGYWNGPTGNRNRMPTTSDVFGKIYGNTVTRTTLQREANKGQLAYALNLDLFTNLTPGAQTISEAVNEFAWNSLVLQHEADALQIEPMGADVHSDERVLNAIKNLPKFQTLDGQFDPKAYDVFKGEYLPSLGFTTDDLEEVVAEDLRMKKIKELLHTTFVISPDEFRALYTAQYQKVDVSVIHFNLADFAAKVQPSDADIQKAFEQHLEGYHSQEKRGIKLATFALSDDEKKLKGKERVAALQQISNKVEDFTQKLQEKGAKFDDVAAQFKVPVTVIPPFALSSPDPKLPEVPDLLDAIFGLTTDNPVSEPVEDPVTGSYYVAMLQEVVPSKLLNLAEARPQVIEELKNSRAMETMNVRAREVRNKIAADLAAGKSFADAAKAEGQTVETYPAFSPEEVLTGLGEGDIEKKLDAREVVMATLDMKEGELSQFVPTEAGGIIIHVDKREPIDPKKFEADKARLEAHFDKGQVDMVFNEWLRMQHEAANVIINAPSNNGNGTPVPPPPK